MDKEEQKEEISVETKINEVETALESLRKEYRKYCNLTDKDLLKRGFYYYGYDQDELKEIIKYYQKHKGIGKVEKTGD